MIYLNNAATSYPKPACVRQAVCQALSDPPQDGARSSFAGASPMEDCRRALARILGVSDPNRIFFTSGATESFNLILRGLPLAGKKAVATLTEHNAVLRPLYALLPKESIRPAVSENDGALSPEGLSRAMEDGADYVFVNHCSNVTGLTQDLAALAGTAHARGALVIADVSQSAGLMPLALEAWGVDIAVFTGHKALFGPSGIGGFYLRPGTTLSSAKWGGTGTGGTAVILNEPDLFEVGTPNLPGLAGLQAGAGFLLETGLDAVRRSLERKTSYLYNALAKLPGVRMYGSPPQGAALAFNISGLMPADVGFILQQVYGIVVRAGYHCAPLMANAIGAPQGTVRASLSYLTEDTALDALVTAVSEIAKDAPGAPNEN